MNLVDDKQLDKIQEIMNNFKLPWFIAGGWSIVFAATLHDAITPATVNSFGGDKGKIKPTANMTSLV